MTYAIIFAVTILLTNIGTTAGVYYLFHRGMRGVLCDAKEMALHLATWCQLFLLYELEHCVYQSVVTVDCSYISERYYYSTLQ